MIKASVRDPTDNMPMTISEEKGGDDCDMASSQGTLSEGEKREKDGGF